MRTGDAAPANAQTAHAFQSGAALQRAIANSVSFSSIATDANGVIQIFNAGAERMLGYAASEVIDRMTALDLHDPEEVIAQAAALSSEFGTTVAAGIDALVFKAARGIEDTYELTKIRKDGSRFPAIVSVTALRDAAGTIIGYLLIGTDNTARHQVDEERRRHQDTLVQHHTRRARDAAHASALAMVNEELEAFSYTVSHDLRAPLRHIHGYVEMLREATADLELSDKAKRYLGTISDVTVEMGQLIDGLLAFSRIGRAELMATVVPLNTMVGDVIRRLEVAIGDRRVEWHIADLPAVVGDASLLKQVFTNLIDNSLKYSRTRTPASIEIGCAGEEDGRVILFVRDNGVGFDMQYVHKLYGVFQRLHRPEEFEGTGIGLATVRRIVARHGGRVWADAALDHGATFFFTLERAPSAQIDVERTTA